MIEKAELEGVRKAKAQIVQGSLTIWNTRLDILQRIGDVRGIFDHVVSASENVGKDDALCNSGNCVAGCNTNCQNKCGKGDLGESILPQDLGITKTKRR